MVESEKISLRCPSCGVVGRGLKRHLESDAACPKCQKNVRFVQVDLQQASPPAIKRENVPNKTAIANQASPKVQAQPDLAVKPDASKQQNQPVLKSKGTWVTGFAEELKLIAIAVKQQLQKLWDHAASQYRLLGRCRQELEAKATLGMTLLRSGQGDAALRSRITELQQRIESIGAAKGSTKSLQVELKGSAIRLADSVLDAPSLVSDVQVSVCQAAIQSRVDLEDSVRKLSSQLIPNDSKELRRVIIGGTISLLCVFGLFVIALSSSWSFTLKESIQPLVTLIFALSGLTCLAFTGYSFYELCTNKDQTEDTRVVMKAIASSMAMFLCFSVLYWRPSQDADSEQTASGNTVSVNTTGSSRVTNTKTPIAATDDFSEEEWEAITKKAIDLGLARDAASAKKFESVLRLVKSIFIDHGIPNPSANQLFNAVSAFTGGGFHNLSIETIDTMIYKTIRVSKSTGMPLTTKKQLEQLEFGH